MHPNFLTLALAFVLALAPACSREPTREPDAGAAPAPADASTAAPADGSVVAGEDAATITECAVKISEAGKAIGVALEAAAVPDAGILTDPAFTVLLETGSGVTFMYSRGASTPSTAYESASTSKWVTAAVLLDLVDQGLLTLDTKAKDLLPFWTEDQVTLKHLLSFTSGFEEEPLCVNLPNADFESCVKTIFDDNVGKGIAPGSRFYYSSTHLQIAGLMAIKAKKAASWTEVFKAFKTRTGLFWNSVYDLPSATNPRLAGGMHWTGLEYLAFLRALNYGNLLSATSREQLFADQRSGAAVEYSPSMALGEDWSYGLGNWLECRTAKTKGSFDCEAGHRNSSPGAYGAYPFIDFDHGYFGIVARQGGLGTFPEGVHLFRAAEPQIQAWAALSCP
ncbi:MAG TPA: serine hydrolase domain-containing protein [Myxococcales bacterium]|jgi:CubicO group peptidase (beta-lactamase class C family)